MKILIATTKKFKIKKGWKVIRNPKELNYENVKKINPTYIFFPYWNWIISKEIYDNFNCIGFHCTDLPFGRGGSPLQNLIIRGIRETKITAFQITKKMDAGGVYLKFPLDISEGSADEIFKKVSKIIYEKMIPPILNYQLRPKDQGGKPTYFKRRVPKQGDISKLDNIKDVHNYIRMLDGEGYPRAFIELNHFTIRFSKSKLKGKKITAEVEIE